jgi:hypothetical protein
MSSRPGALERPDITMPDGRNFRPVDSARTWNRKTR